MIEQSTQGEKSDQAIAQAARAWAVELEQALDGVAERDGLVLFPAEVVAAGAQPWPDNAGCAGDESRRGKTGT